MKINKRIRIKVIKRKLKRLHSRQKSYSPFSYYDDYKIYKEIEYWEDLLELIK